MEQSKQEFIREKAKQSLAAPDLAKVLWSRQAIAELVNLQLSRHKVTHALQHASLVIDFRPLHNPLPDCLVLLRLKDSQPIHAVIAVDPQSDTAVVVRLYRPTLEEWQDGWRKRTS